MYDETNILIKSNYQHTAAKIMGMHKVLSPDHEI